MKYYQELQEGLYDPNIFKAFFLAGGPGSGKTYVVRRTTGGSGLKIVNSDDAFELLLKKAGLSLKMPPEETEPREVEKQVESLKFVKPTLLKEDLGSSSTALVVIMIKLLVKLKCSKGWAMIHI